MNRSFHQVLRNDFSELERLDAAAGAFFDAHAIPDRARYVVLLVLEELITNTIKYGHDDHATHGIDVGIELKADHLLVRVEDDGRAFDPTDAAEPATDLPLERRPIGGLGLLLVARLAARVEYSRLAGRNLVEVRVNL